jgi:DNA polymerase/3'-5' exonuclease PolX
VDGQTPLSNQEDGTCGTDNHEESSLAVMDTKKGESVRVEHDKEVSVAEEPSEEHGNASTPDLSERIQDEPPATADEVEQPESPAIQGTQDLMERIRCRIEADALTWDEQHAAMNQVGDGANDGFRVEDTNSHQNDEHGGLDEKGNVTRGEMQVVDSVPVESSSLAETPGAAVDARRPPELKRMIEVVDLVSQTAAIDANGQQQGKQRSEDAVLDLHSVRDYAETPRFKLFFLHLGQSSKVIQIRANAAKSKGALVTSTLEDATHLIISGNPSAAAVASFLKFRDASALASFLMERHIDTCKSEWIVQSDTLKEPTVQQLWNGLAFFQPTIPQQSRKRRRSETSSHPEGSRPPTFAMNMKISDCFQILSKLHQDLQRLRKVDGIGESTLNKIKEYLRTGTLERIAEFQADELRVAMNTMMHIWGVGAAKASDLLNAGYRTIPQVRKDVKSGKLGLTRNQMIGLECYEDFLEKMERTEVEEIGNIVAKAVHERFPSANVMIMGSYRRGKSTCGDIDLLITHPGYMEATPLGALGELVDRLRQRGHIAYHLTHLTGMREEESSQSSASQQVPPPEPGPYPHSSSYMGVFYSPTAGKKRRRIDIKFYPYRERAFASLYFTGNGWFNRSMRQWSKRAKQMTLNDHGFFSIQRQEKRLPIEADTERQVFDILGLVYKEPTERDCFDAVIPIEGGSIEMSRSDLFPTSNEKWID